MPNIGSTISTTALHFSNSPVSFEVTVENLSNDFASFKVNLTAAGADPNIGDSWYSLEPKLSRIPSGDITKFSVTILTAPILGMDLINVTVKVSSLELPDIIFHSLRLLVSSVPPKLLKVDLPVNSFAIYPRKILDIPVRVSNPNHYQVDVVLRLIGLESRWLERGTERRLLIGAGREGETTFTCQPPIVKYTPCGIYPFTIKAYVNNEERGKTKEGKIDILPIGTVFFSITPEYHVLPSKASWLPQFQIKPATYQLEFKNVSNVAQNHITIAVEESKCDCKVIPPYGEAKPGETLNLKLEATKKRHWWGLKRKYPLKITPSLSDLRLNTTEPSSQNVELWVHPLLPLWLQLGFSAIALVIILWLLSITGHSDRVNSVTFSSDINPILSGSKDGTVRKWKATPDRVFCKWLQWQRFCLQHENVLWDNKKETGKSDRVNVVKFRSDRNVSGKFAFLGFDSGKAIKLNVLTEEKTIIIDDRYSSNRILDITTSDFKTIFWGRGTKLLQLNIENNSSQDLIPQNISIHVLTLTPDNKNIIAGGQSNKIFLVNLNGKSRYKSLNLHPVYDKDADQITGLKITENNILISTDNRGLMQIWNFNKCLQGECDEPLYSNEGAKDRGINAIALTKYKQNKYYLVTGDTEGKINIWSFIADVNSVNLNFVKTIGNYPQQITSIDLIHQKTSSHNRLLILSGSQDSRVRLDIFNLTP
ncbi:MAG: hypothetical protein QNJ34_03660 [Xenococcaceae cyanobacterium MO_188.B29]|nr:hypothetical protein [Xenococcaceae cyanobacterium MO_188.B29]